MATENGRSPVEQLLVDLSIDAYSLAIDLGSLLIRLRHYSCDDLAAIPEDLAGAIHPELEVLRTRLREHRRATRVLIGDLETVRNEGRGGLTWPEWSGADREVLPKRLWEELLSEFAVVTPSS